MMQILNILIGLLLVLTTNTLNLAEQLQHRLPLEPTDHSAPITALLNTTNTLKLAESSRSIEIVAAAFAIGQGSYFLLKTFADSIRVDKEVGFQISNQMTLPYSNGKVQLVQGKVAMDPGRFRTDLNPNQVFTYKVNVGYLTGTRGAGCFKIDNAWFFFMWSIPNTGRLIGHHTSVAIGGCKTGDQVKWKDGTKLCESIRGSAMDSTSQTDDGLYAAMKTTNLDPSSEPWFRRATYGTKWVYTHHNKGAANGEDITSLPDVQVKVGNKWIQLLLPENDNTPFFAVNVHPNGEESTLKRVMKAVGIWKLFGGK